MDENAVKKAEQEVKDLLRPHRRNLLSKWYHRYFMGDDSSGILPEEELKAKLNWNDDETEINEIRIRVIRGELTSTTEILRDQFAKIGGLIALLGFIIAIGLSRRVSGDTLTLKVICLAAAYAVWAQSPRMKVLFKFRKRQDAGLRTGRITSQWDEFYYVYCWLVRREHTTNSIESLVMGASLLTIVALGFVFFNA